MVYTRGRCSRRVARGFGVGPGLMDARVAKPYRDESRQDLALIQSNVLVHLLRYADVHGVPCRGWLDGLGLTRDQLLDPNMRLSYRQVHTIIVRALRSCGEPGLGLLVGDSENLGVFGLLGLLMMTAATFGEAVRLGVENHEVSGSLLDMDFEDLGGGEAALLVWPRFDDPLLQPFLCEEIMASSLAAARELVGHRFAPLRVELTYAAPAHAELYPRVLGARTTFNAAANRIVLDARWLATPLPGHNPLASRQALELCRTQQSRMHADPEQEIVATVERLLRTHCCDRLHIAEVGRELHLSERSLRRGLAGAGCSFRQIHDRVRVECALELLAGGRMPMSGIAGALGFSDAREFRRAFKRWTGLTPQAVRRSRAAAHLGRIAPLGRMKRPFRADA